MSKALFFNISATGHINPTLPVLREMVAAGETVVCVNGAQVAQQYEGVGVRFVPYPDLPEMAELLSRAQGGNLFGNALALTDIGGTVLPFVFSLIEQEQPDYIIFDSLAGWGKQAAIKYKLPHIASISTFVLGYGVRPDLPLPAILKGVVDLASYYPRYYRASRAIQSRLGVQPTGLMGALMNTGQASVVFTSRTFHPSGEQLPQNFKCVGPSFGSRPAMSDFPLEEWQGQPRIYIALGTINNQNLDFYRQCFQAFADHPGQVLLSVGRQTKIEALGRIPANFLVHNFVPQLEVLQRADVFITHGGMGSVHEGLYYGVPLIVVPQQMEQAIVAQQVAKCGAGLALGVAAPGTTVSAQALRQAIDTIMQDQNRYQQAAQHIGQSFRAAGGAVQAAQEFMRFGRGVQ
jgi:MGT family glycosyltransferase